MNDNKEHPETSCMEKPSRKKSPIRFVFGACALYGLVKILPGIWVNLVYLFVRTKPAFPVSKAISVGVIGGADGPTSVFIAGPVWTAYLWYAALFFVGIWGFYHFGGFQKQK